MESNRHNHVWALAWLFLGFNHQAFAQNNNFPLGKDTTLCEGQRLTLNATQNTATYEWQDGSTNATLNVTQQGTYYVKMTLTNQVFSDTINVTYRQYPKLDLGKDTTLCKGDLLIKNLFDVNADKYIWQDGNTNPWYLVQKSGIYSVTATNANCSASAKIKIIYNSFPTLRLGKDTVFCESKPLRINAQNDDNYKSSFTWSNGEKTPQILVKEANTYWVKVNKNGCTTTDTITIRAKECHEFQLYAPNAFSPNQDDNNDEWRVFTSTHFAVTQFSLKIFDRWGNHIFENQDITQSWNGEQQQEGIYIYQLSLTYRNPENQKEETFQQSGDISLFR